jgi:hypothetical protein
MIPTVTVDQLMMEEREISLFTWCDAPHDRTVEVYADSVAALQAGLRRATYSTPANGTHET